jgi:surface polysaccharide O-acyltransferase-like enzyme
MDSPEDNFNSSLSMDRRISLLRILACFMVVLLHVSAENFHAFGNKWWAANFFDSLTRACVPIFFMVAGATLLPKQETLSVFFKKRFLRIIPTLLFWSAFYLWWLQHNGVAVGNWVVAILSGPTMFHLWYFYAIIGLYLFIPVLRKFYQHSTRTEQAWFITAWFVISSIYPTVYSLSRDPSCGYLRLGLLADTYHLSYFGGYIGYFLLGAFLVEGKSSVKNGLTIFVIASIGTMAGTYLISRYFNAPCEFFYLYQSPLVVLAAGGLFMAFMGMRRGAPSKEVAMLSDCALGIYCIHVFIIDPVFKRAGISATVGNPWITSLSTAMGVFVVSFGVIYFGRKLKVFRYVT